MTTKTHDTDHVERAKKTQLAAAPAPQENPDGTVRMYGKPRLLKNGWDRDSCERSERLRKAYGAKH